ncbi:E3 ubiquitin/ISG15 ligase TRIM25-like [Hyla sarda]|uniref:E3 ubiquitin/ISG15 ligase TRIM25-like n=1 Tax=Hyla sarda TaxID=327740 RepID=UPI0024C42527|nr:E3 ubiquitin/ISG15 ligase TRIM25-like [Hyla sarda]
MEEPIYSNILLNNYEEPVIPIQGNIYSTLNTNPRSRSEWQKEVMDNSRENVRISCTHCVSAPAVKWCTLCEVSLCDVHHQLHSKSREHVLMNPMETKDQKCSIHNEVLNYYCIDDAICVCASCCHACIHKYHQIESLFEASERKKKGFKTILEKLHNMQEYTDVRVEILQCKRLELKDKASNLSVRVSDLFRDFRCKLDNLELKVLNDIAKEQSQLSEPISLLIQKMEQQKDELSRNISLIEELCNLSNPLTMLRRVGENQADFLYPKARPSLFGDPDDLDEGLILVSLQRSLNDIMAQIKRWHWVSDVTMDVSTAANDVYVSGDKRTASWSKINQRREKAPERFKSHQVVSTQRYSSGRHYWEIDISPSGKWIVGVCYPSMDRKGELSVIGKNDKSWGLGYADNKYKAIHDRTEKHLPSMLPCNKIGVYLDYESGHLSYYEVSDVIRHLHTFTTTFTEPVHAIFWVSHSWMRVNS